MIGRALLAAAGLIHVGWVKVCEWRGWSHVRVAAARLRGAQVGAGTVIDADCYLAGASNITIDDRVYVGRGTAIVAYGSKVSIGAGTRIAAGCKFISRNHDVSAGLCLDDEKFECAPIIVGVDVWLGYNAIVLPGVSIGDHAVVGAGAVVTKSVAPFDVVGGVPARKIGTRSAKSSVDV